ncbi:MAG: hypothetical protein D6701_00130, partial [Gemmatimonadetes bacterium]
MSRRRPLEGERVPFVVRAAARLLPARHREAFVGDLLEEYRRFVLPGRSPGAARGWLVRQALASGVAGALARLRARLGRVLGDPLYDVRPPHDHRPPGAGIMESFWYDLRYAMRRLSAAPGFTAVAALSLALGIGANTAIFSVVDALLLRDMPVEDPASLVEIYMSEEGGYPYATASYPDYVDLRERADLLEDVAAFEQFFAQVEVEGDLRLVMGELVTANAFPMLGLRPALGRWFTPDEDTDPGAHAVVMLSHGYWERVFGADRGVLGRTIRVLGTPYEIIGVAPEGFNGLFPGIVSELYLPMSMVDHVQRTGAGDSRLVSRGSRSLFLKGRLAEGATVEQLNEFLESLSRDLEEAHPDTNRNRVFSALPYEDVAIHPFVDRALFPVAGLLFAVVGLVLLIACTNLAAFLLARAS